MSRSSTPHSFSSGGQDSRSPVLSSGSGVFENEVPRKKSQPHSDKGYGSTTSVSSGSSADSKCYIMLGFPQTWYLSVCSLTRYLSLVHSFQLPPFIRKIHVSFSSEGSLACFDCGAWQQLKTGARTSGKNEGRLGRTLAISFLRAPPSFAPHYLNAWNRSPTI